MNDEALRHISLSTGDWVALVGYLLATILMGIWFSFNEKTSEDFLLGGRKVPWFAVGISFMMSLLSTYSLVMVPGEIFNHGLSLFVIGLLYPLLLVASFHIFVRFYFKLRSFTPFEYLGRRYDESVRLLVSIVYLWTRLLYLGMVLFTSSKVFEGGAGWPAWLTITVVGTIGIIYTVMGGMKAVIWTDVLQFVVMAVGLIGAVYICLRKVDGGLAGTLEYSFAHGRGPSLYADTTFYTLDPYMRLCFWLVLIGVVTEALFYTSADQISIQRLLSTSSYENARKAIVINALLSWPFMLITWLIGLAIFTYYSQHPDPSVSSGDTAFFTFIATELPTPLPGLLLAAMLAAAMSTLDSGMNSLASVCVKEYYVKHLRPSATETDQVRISRLAIVAVGVFSMALGCIIAISADTLQQSVVEAVTIFSGLASILVPIYLLAVTTQRANGKLIWRLTLLSWGINIGMVTWYLVSLRGLIGPISSVYILIPLGVAMIMFMMSLACTSHRYSRILKVVGLFPFGYAFSVTLWYVFARFTDGGKLSFLWTSFPGLVAFLGLGYLAVFLSPHQAGDKNDGLTLWTLNKQKDAIERCE